MFKYRAFISYNRADRASAKLLQRRLEQYVLPRALRLIKPGLRHDSRPLKPVFRDEDELVPGSDLPARIRAGLEQSEYLIVVCSPSAVASEWVDKEIREFIARGGAGRVLAVVVDGEPEAASRGLSPSLECLPRALRFQLDVRRDEQGEAIGEVSDRRAMPLWVDWRNDTKRNHPMFLRLVAALLSLSSLDELIRRDRAYRRRRLILSWMVGLTVAAALVGLAVILALSVRGENAKDSDRLAGLARQAGGEGDWERSARYGLLAMRGADYPLIGFAARRAEDALIGALMESRRVGLPHDPVTKPDATTVLSRDGSVLAVVQEDGTVELHDTSDGKVRGVPIHTKEMLALAVSPDGKLIATQANPLGENPHTEFRIWDVSTGAQIFQTFTAGESFLLNVQMQFSSDDKKLMIAGQYGDGGGTATLFDLANGITKELESYYGGIDSIAISPDGTIAAASWEEGVQVWHADTGAPVGGIIGEFGTAPTKVLALAPDNSTLAVGTSAGLLILWDYQERKEAMNLNTGSPIAALTFSRDSRRLGVQFRNDSVSVWQGPDPRHYAATGVRFMPATQFAFLPDDQQMAILAAGSVGFWRLDPHCQDLPVSRDGRFQAESAFSSADGRVLAAGTPDGGLMLLDPETFAPIGPAVTFSGLTDSGGTAERVAFSSDHNLIARQNEHGAWLVNLRTGDQWPIPDGALGWGAVTFAPDGKTLALETDRHTDISTDRAAGSSKQVQLWDVNSRRPVGAAIPAPDGVSMLSFAPDGASLALGGESSKAVMVWDLKRGARILPSIAGTGLALFLPDGKGLLTNGPPSTDSPEMVLQLWDTITGLPVGPRLKPNVGAIRQVIFIGDGSRAVVVGGDSMALWDLAAGLAIGAPRQADYGDVILTAYLSRDQQEVRVVTSGKHFYIWKLGAGLALHGPGLANAVCQAVLPGSLSHLSAAEVTAASLDRKAGLNLCSH